MASTSMQPPNYTELLMPEGHSAENRPLIPKDTPQKFTTSSRYNDVWASILFGLNLVVFGGLNIFSFKTYASNTFHGAAQGQASFIDHSLTVLILSSIFVSFGLAFGYFVLIQRQTSLLVKSSFLLSVALVFAIGVTQLLGGSLFWGGLNIFVGVIILLCYNLWAARMRMAVLLLQTVSSVTRRYPGTLAVAISGLFTQILWSSLWIFSLAINYSVFQKISNCHTDSDGKAVCESYELPVVMTYLAFVMFWNSEVIKNVVHTTISGVFAAYYFLEGSAQGMPSSPTLTSGKRALTTSFGSVCFGSLLIALLQTLRYVLNSARSDSDDGFAAFIAMCADCILSCLEGLFEIFNKFAFTQVAMYGKPFIVAAKDTWELIKDRGVDAIVNDSLVGNVLGMGALLVAILSGLYGYLFLKIVRPSFAEGDEMATVVVVLVEMVLGAVMISIPNNVLDSGVTTTFVALAEDPEALHRTKPELYQAFVEEYPQVRYNVRGLQTQDGHH
ncbi:putative choline transporter, neither null mutation nor overexpression affects choline transport [Actinomortierella ambigua]|uniref:Protein PNS1 n=1 Tax=Actinomortierella ambigua TaxID=1343610 RepID=A0A9P6PZ31_9FUNG|nr:putative choline transporter, neither null mutation nor overexpression affects choline transport [Actinomortierella ambigua]KAG0257033.1 putative choline transporter, neither null mutation nor overexpression affects choline transport [Actinomortierella ambigua]